MKTLIHNIGRLQTPLGHTPQGGTLQGRNQRLESGAILIEDGIIQAVYSGGAEPEGDFERIDAGGRLVTPGLVDCHTHLVFGGWRQHEIPLKLQGAGYLDILRAGGGILDTVRRTRQAEPEALYQKAAGILDQMLGLGVTTVEAKSGYGLDLETEVKQLEVAARLQREHVVEVVSTFLGAHAIPPEYAGDADGYIDLLCQEILPKAAPLAEYCDAFCEEGVFTAAQSRRVLLCARELGLGLKIHADEIAELGGVPLAGELGAVSAEHLIATGPAGLDALADSGVIAALLPGTSFYLNKDYAPAREMIDRGIPVAVASDFNPGSCPSFNLQFCVNLAYLKYRLQPEEILTAVTLNAACAIGRGDRVGTIEPGKQADLIIWEASDLEMLCYRYGLNQVHTVIKRGKIQ